MSDDSSLTLFLHAIGAKDTKQAIAVIGDIEKKGGDIRIFIRDVLKSFETKLIGSIEGKEDKEFSISELTTCISVFTKAWGDMKISPIPSLPALIAVVGCTKTESVSEETVVKIHEEKSPIIEKSKTEAKPQPEPQEPETQAIEGNLTTEKLTDCWKDVIEAFKPYNHSIAGVLRSARPKSVEHGVVTIEAFYTFHKEKLSEPKSKDIMVTVFKKLFGEKVRIDVIVGKK